MSKEKKQIEKQDLVPALSYVGVLFLVPMLLKKDDFSQFHAKQGLVLFVAEAATMIVAMFPILGWIVSFFAWILWLMLSIIGIVNVLKGNKKKLPVIGDFADRFKI